MVDRVRQTAYSDVFVPGFLRSLSLFTHLFMPKPSASKSFNAPSSPSQKSSEHDQYAYLRAEAKAPYRVLRRFIYVAFGASGLIGALVFLAQVLTFHDMGNAIPNLALQLGVLALMLWLFKIDRPK